MTKRVFRHTRRRRSSIGLPLLSSAFLVILGGGLFWGGMNWLRSGSDAKTAAVAAETESLASVLAPVSVSAAEPLLLRASLISAFDGQATGVVNRMPGEKSADYHLIAYLPGIDNASETYAVWLLKDGLADVKRMGDLSPRADGSWVTDFTAGALSGIAEPGLYRTLVIMKEKRAAADGERGQKIAEAQF